MVRPFMIPLGDSTVDAETSVTVEMSEAAGDPY
jgi:hypothetical protein